MRKRKVRRGATVYEMEAPLTTEPASETPGDHQSGPTPGPAATDPLGIPLTEPMLPVFGSLADFQAAKFLHMQLSGLLDRIARAPGGEILRQHLQRKTDNGTEMYACAELDGVLQKLVAAEPYCSFCPRCHAMRLNCFLTDCQTCRGRGWVTRPAFEACPENQRRELLYSSQKPAS